MVGVPVPGHEGLVDRRRASVAGHQFGFGRCGPENQHVGDSGEQLTGHGHLERDIEQPDHLVSRFVLGGACRQLGTVLGLNEHD